MIGLLALDLDGTLLKDDLELSPETQRAVRGAVDRGVIVTLATGRMLSYTAPYARDLGISAPLICYQGGLIQAADAPSPLYRAVMGEDVAREFIEWQYGTGHDVAMYSGDGVYAAGSRRLENLYRDMLGYSLEWMDDLSLALERGQPLKFLVLVDPADGERVRSELRRVFGKRVELTRSHERIIEANPPGVTKADGLRRLAAHLGVSRRKVMAIGDQDNDAEMIAWAGLGVAMGNGSAAAKAASDWVAPPVSEDGAAVAIECFVLEEQAVSARRSGVSSKA
jgi:Cof subfamily protein (haloacid dehalogenase superfamily)